MNDAELVDRVLVGFDDAFDELYRRHAASAWRVGQAVARTRHDAAEAVSEAFARVLHAVRAGKLRDGDGFRSYLLTATRNAAVEGLRRNRATPADEVVDTEDTALLAQAFRNLPERWRSVLWLTEVEGVAIEDAADQLGLSANSTAQLAGRARAGLRDRYLQAHLKRSTEPAELENLGTALGRIARPIPPTLGALSAERVHAVLTAASIPVPAGFARAVQLAKEPTPFMRKAVGASAAGVLAAGLLALPFVGNGSDGRVRGLEAPSASSGAPAAVEFPAASFGSVPSYSLSPGAGASVSTARRAFSAPRATQPSKPPARPVTKGTPPAATKPDQSDPGLLPAPVCDVLSLLCGAEGGGTPPLPAVPPVTVGVNLGGHEVGLGVTLTPTPAAGAVIDGTTVGSPATAAPATSGVTVGPVTVPLG